MHRSLFLLGLWWTAWVARPRKGTAPPPAQVRPGIDVLLTDSVSLIRNRRVGLVTNQSGVDAHGKRDLDRLGRCGAPGDAVFAPEHGFRGTIDVDQAPDTRQNGTRPPEFRLPSARRRTTPPAHCRDARGWTFSWWISRMSAPGTIPIRPRSTSCRQRVGVIPVVVLDRPNPIGGAVQGDVQDSVTASAIARFPIAMRHGMTIGELARLANATLALGADLHRRAASDGWRRSMSFDATGLPFVPPEPESTHPRESLSLSRDLSVRGYQSFSRAGKRTRPSSRSARPGWIRPRCWRAASLGPSGSDIQRAQLHPSTAGRRKIPDTLVAGIRLTTTDRGVYDPTVTAVALACGASARLTRGIRWSRRSSTVWRAARAPRCNRAGRTGAGYRRRLGGKS